MKKRLLTKKLSLKKTTIASLKLDDLRQSRAGEDKTRLMPSCETVLHFCCETGPNCK